VFFGRRNLKQQGYSLRVDDGVPWYLRNGHCQSLWPYISRLPIPADYSPHRVILDDGDFLECWYPHVNTGRFALVLPGLEGNITSHYVATVLQGLRRADITGVVMHSRGCSAQQTNPVRRYHGGETQDIATVVDFLCAKFGVAKVRAIGVSLGANMLLKWLGDCRPSQIESAIAISPPFDLAAAVRFMARGNGRLYHRYLLNGLKRAIRRHYSPTTSLFDFNRAVAVRTIYDFDDCVTAPMHGFADADDYYARCSCGPFVAKIDQPVLILSSEDDPVIPFNSVPRRLGSGVTLKIFRHGGHAGFFGRTRSGLLGRRIEDEVGEFFLANPTRP